VLVIDGTWSREDMKVLQRAGWDYIFYPDEMAELVKLLRSFDMQKKREITIPEEDLPLAAESGNGVKLRRGPGKGARKGSTEGELLP
jgi:hypothetical protein